MLTILREEFQVIQAPTTAELLKWKLEADLQQLFWMIDADGIWAENELFQLIPIRFQPQKSMTSRSLIVQQINSIHFELSDFDVQISVSMNFLVLKRSRYFHIFRHVLVTRS